MSKKRVLMIGVASGMGLMAAEKLLDQDVELFAAAPDIEPMRSLEAKGATLISIDVTQESSVNEGIASVIDAMGGIDVLHFNAGVNISGPIEVIPSDAIDLLFQVNVFGLSRVLKAISPHFREKRAGRIVVTGSVISHVSVRMMGWYAATKHALFAMMTAYRQEVADFGIEVVLIEPGQINTGFDQAAMARTEQFDYPEDYKGHLQEFLAFNTANLSKCPDGTRSAEIMVQAITTAKPKLIYKTSKDATTAPLIQRVLGTKLTDKFVIDAYKKHAP